MWLRIRSAFRDPRFRQRAELGLAVALAVGLVLSILLLTGVTTPLDPLLDDLVYRPYSPTGQVVIIAIDKKSLAELGAWPWPRSIHTGLLDRLSAAPPRVIAFDFLFSQASPEDPALASSVRKSGNVQLAVAGPEAAAFQLEKNSFPQYSVLLLPSPGLRDLTPIGHRTIPADPDGIVRRIPLEIGDSSGTFFPALGVSAAMTFRGDVTLKPDLPNRQVWFGASPLPVDEYGRMMLEFARPQNGMPTFSYSDVFRGVVPASTFQGKIVFIGGTSESEQETYEFPGQGDSSVYNVNLQADVADMLIRPNPITLQPLGLIEEIALTLLFSLLAGLTLPHMRPVTAAAATLIYILGMLVLAFSVFSYGLLVRVLYPAVALVICFAIIGVYRYFSEERRRQFLTSLFRRYVPPESVGTVVDAVNRGELPLSGAKRVVTVLYCDLRGFSKLSEGLAPEAVLDLVNRYLELLISEVHAEEGTVNKPMGDALVAIWNAPLDQPEHALQAIRTAINMRRRLVSFHRDAPEEEVLNIGFGLATGWAILGNMSALGKVEYTLIGETVNVAARISAFAGGNQILADSATVENLTPDIERRELSPVRIRGRREPLPVWEIQDTAQQITGAEEEPE